MQRKVEINKATRQREIRRHIEGKWRKGQREKIRKKAKARRDKQ
jgi:hypothetical protein